ncbi:MAG: MmcQ/YjbR family DNA-binding protein [Bacteroidia bacterium]|nr:MmcQ/YjbR family DNA-binding protein [Bacteroidia bacterium]
MNIDMLRTYCQAKAGCGEDFPFDDQTLVFKVGGKIFCLASLDSIPLQINLKCDPERAVELREQFEAILPGYHMNKKHWNTLVLDGSLSSRLVRELIDHSYQLVVNTLPATVRSALLPR